ncbi:secretin N-terminal domain-containing protein [Sulfuriroseicoccus oceanibius]|uniref:Uncharacterized protein n=1 Tax=Sulfuriroseicoccus oceanibius TaxID=2707525 RepID=A0A6B3LEV5_9BACT|nr:secretin N-terminal domain-containing protein [Sulfuriroseicoccus oceanibius]QQL44811.1 hypothetical protein G3M56_013165 [Sulfuriroseicoccus oceanibius]
MTRLPAGDSAGDCWLDPTTDLRYDAWQIAAALNPLTIMMILNRFNPSRLTRVTVACLALGMLASSGLNEVHAQVAPAAGQVEEEEVLQDGIMFPNASIIRVVLPIYQKYTGNRVILDTDIADNNVRIVLAGPVKKSEAVAFIEETLLMNGYAFIPTSRQGTLKLIAVGGKNPAGEGAAVYNDQMPLPKTDEVITYIMNFNHITAEEAMQVFQASGQLHSYGTMAVVPNSGALVITENVSLIRRFQVIRENIDKPSAQIDRKFIQLERADAERVAELLQEVLGEQNSVTKAASVSGRQMNQQQPDPRDRRGRRGRPQQPQSNIVTNPVGVAPPIKVIPDARTNRILVMARPVDVAYVESLVAEFDAPNKARTFLQRQLNHISASNVLPLIADAISRETGETAEQGSAGSQSSGSRGAGMGSNAGGRSQTGGIGGGSGLGSGGTGGNRGSISLGSNDVPVPVGATSIVVGKTLLISDNERNALIVSGPPETIELAERLMDQLDIRPRQIYLATIVGQMTLGNQLEYGVDALRTLENVNGNPEINVAGQMRTNSGAGIVDTDTLTDIANFPDAAGLSLYGRFAGSLSTYVRFLENTGKFKVLSRPVVYTANNQTAVIQSGQRIAVPTSTLTSINSGVNDGAVTSNIQYRDVVLRLEVVPLINSDNQVRLQIYQVNDNISGSTNVGGNDIPTIATQELVTTVTVEDGQSVLLGGLITESEQKTRSGVPVLKSIPLVKYLFSTTRTDVRREELMFFIQPRIIDSQEDLDAANLAETDRGPGKEEILRFVDPRAQTKEEPLPIWEGQVNDDPDPEVRRAIPVKEKINKVLFD